MMTFATIKCYYVTKGHTQLRVLYMTVHVYAGIRPHPHRVQNTLLGPHTHIHVPSSAGQVQRGV